MTQIIWTDKTWNPVTGCTKVSDGCKYCYAEREWPRFHGKKRIVVRTPNPERPNWYPDSYTPTDPNCPTGEWTRPRLFTDVQCHDDRLEQPLHWKSPSRIFVASMGDIFHDDVPDSFRDRIFAVMASCPQHTFQILTKRPELAEDYLTGDDVRERIANAATWAKPGVWSLTSVWPLPNVHLGVSAEDQRAAEVRIQILFNTPAAIRWVSVEPLLGAIDFVRLAYRDIYGSYPIGARTKPCSGCGGEVFLNALSGSTCCNAGCDGPTYPALDWVVVGGESGPKARPMHPDWVRSLRDQCAGAGVPFLFKQWGEWGPTVPVIDEATRRIEQYDLGGMARIGNKRAGRLLDGVLHDQYPEP